MTRRRLLRLTFADREGVPYHVAELPPRVARRLLDAEMWVALYLDDLAHPLHHLTWAAVSRCRRSARVLYPGGKQCRIDAI